MATINLFDVSYCKKFPFIQISKDHLFAIFFQALVVGIAAFFFETFLDFAITGSIYDRGFLIGPFLPIYFFMIFLGLLFLKIPLPTGKNLFCYFFIIGGGISAFEWIVGNLFEAITGAILWSYDGFLPFSYRYVSLSVACIWGICGTFYLMFVVPWLKKRTDRISEKGKRLITGSFSVLFLLDLFFSVFLIIKNDGYHELYEIHANPAIFFFFLLEIAYLLFLIWWMRFLQKQTFKCKKVARWIFFLLMLFPFFTFYEKFFPCPAWMIFFSYAGKCFLVFFFSSFLCSYFFLIFFSFILKRTSLKKTTFLCSLTLSAILLLIHILYFFP